MADLIKKELRIDGVKLKNIRELMVKYEETNEAKFFRELIDIGYAVKKSQLEASTEGNENWEAVYQDAAVKMIECHHLIRQSFAFNYDANLSEYNHHKVAVKANEIASKMHVKTLLSNANNTEKTKGTKVK